MNLCSISRCRKKCSAVLVIALFFLFPSSAFAFQTGVIDWVIQELCGHITGGFGALLTAVALLGAVVSAALGSFRVFFGAIIVGVGSFTVPNILSMYFPSAAKQCVAPSGGRAQGGELIDINIPSDPPPPRPGTETGIARLVTPEEEGDLAWRPAEEEAE